MRVLLSSCRHLLSLGAIVALAVVAGSALAAKPPACRDGRFLLPGGGLEIVEGLPAVEAIELVDGRITLAPLDEARGRAVELLERRDRLWRRVRRPASQR